MRALAEQGVHFVKVWVDIAPPATPTRITREMRAEIGPLEPGKVAELILLDADPLAEITNTRRPTA